MQVTAAHNTYNSVCRYLPIDTNVKVTQLCNVMHCYSMTNWLEIHVTKTVKILLKSYESGV